MIPSLEKTKKILAINFGGIGDEVLFLPTLKTIRQAYPSANLTLMLEPRSQSIKQITKLIDGVVTFDIKKKPLLPWDYLELIAIIRRGGYELVLSSGSSPLVSILVSMSGAKWRIGYESGLLSKVLLTHPVKLNRNQYAADMYHDLAAVLVEGGENAGESAAGLRPAHYSSDADDPPPDSEGAGGTPAVPAADAAVEKESSEENLEGAGVPPAVPEAENSGRASGTHAVHGKRWQVPEVFIRPDAMNRMQSFLKEYVAAKNPSTRFVLMHPGTSKLAIQKGIIKTWSIENWVKLIGLCEKEESLLPILAGGPEDTEIIEAIMKNLPPESKLISAAGKTQNLADLAALTSLCKLLVCVDSAPMHIAVGTATPVVALFGPTDPAKLLPAIGKFKALRPAASTQDARGVQLEPEAVFQAVMDQLPIGKPAQSG